MYVCTNSSNGQKGINEMERNEKHRIGQKETTVRDDGLCFFLWGSGMFF